MFWRWFIRICFVLPMLLCVGVWIASYARFAQVSFMGDDLWTLGAGNGQVGLEYWPAVREKYGWRTGEPTWTGSLERPAGYAAPAILNSGNADYKGEWHFVGFSFLWNDIYQPGRWAGGIPLWFVSTLWCTALLVVWRKTGKARAGRAFPVEPYQPYEEKVGKAV